jgi:hypothetical protein
MSLVNFVDARQMIKPFTKDTFRKGNLVTSQTLLLQLQISRLSRFVYCFDRITRQPILKPQWKTIKYIFPIIFFNNKLMKISII